jgi:hypothetical protein
MVAPMPVARESVVRWTMVTVLFSLSAYHVALTASTVLTFGLRYPFMDQFRLNLRYLTVPFPQNVLLLENGHRPILPGLVRVIELQWLGGTQLLQALTSWFAAAVVVAMLLLSVRRDLRGHPVLWAAGVCAICTTVVWNANARMFIHAYEAMHVFYIAAFVVVAVHFAVRASETGSWKYWLGSIVACVGATFSFGMGLASFAAVMVVAMLRRCGRLPLLLLVLSAMATFLVYYIVLPGAQGVQIVTSGPSLPAVTLLAIARVGAAFAELLRPVSPNLALRAAVAASAGAVAIAGVSVLAVRQWHRRAPFVDTELYGLGLFSFGVVANLLIAGARTAYFFDHAGELFADRYLFWSAVTWLGLYLYLLPRLARAGRIGQFAAAATVILFSLAAVGPARWDNQWSADVYRATTLAGISMKLGLRNDAQTTEITDGDVATAYRAADEMRSRNLGLLADLSNLRVGDKVEVAKSPLTVPAKAMRFDVDWPVGTNARMISGELPKVLAAQEQGAELWFADASGTLIGRAAFTNAGSVQRNKLRLGIPTLSGFQGYAIRASEPAALLARDPDGAIRELSRLQLHP